MTFGNVPPEHYADDRDVEAILMFPDFDRELCARALQQAAGELNTALAMRGISPPIETPEYLREKLRRATAYGAAAAVLGAPRLAVKPDDVQGTVQLYLGEYHRVLDEIGAWTTEQIAALGLGQQSGQSPPRTAAVGIVLAGNKWTDEGTHWSHRPPFILKNE